jgi:hypothetical protein
VDGYESRKVLTVTDDPNRYNVCNSSGRACNRPTNFVFLAVGRHGCLGYVTCEQPSYVSFENGPFVCMISQRGSLITAVFTLAEAREGKTGTWVVP